MKKSIARAAARLRRAELHRPGVDHTAFLREVLAPYAQYSVALYHPIGSEIDPLPVLDMLQNVSLPIVVSKGQPLLFRAWQQGAPLVEGAFGAQIPAQGPTLCPQVIIVPMLAFNPQGHRLGYGGGFYDRTLTLTGAKAIGFAYAGQEREDFPVGEFDHPLDMIVTERGVILPQG